MDNNYGNVVLSRKKGESVTINTSDGPIIIYNYGPSKTKLGVMAPKYIKVLRSELKNK